MGSKHAIMIVSKVCLGSFATEKEDFMIYGYCRVSTNHQRITRQITNIRAIYPSATLIKEFFTGTTQNRPLWDKPECDHLPSNGPENIHRAASALTIFHLSAKSPFFVQCRPIT